MANELASIKRLLRASPADPNIILEQDWDALVNAVQAALNAKSPVASPVFSGNSGFGTTPDPNARVDVAGAIRWVGGSDPGTGSAVYSVASGSFQTVMAGAVLAFHTGANGARAERMRLDIAGNFGIGVSPTCKLHVSGGDSTNALINGSTKGVRFLFNSTSARVEGVDNTGIGSYQPLVLAGSTAQMISTGNIGVFVAANGNVGINTVSPGAEAEIAANGGDSDARLQMRANGSEIAQFGVSTSLAFLDAGTKPWAFYGGNVTHGTDNTRSSGSASLRWSTVFAGTGAINTSDARMKALIDGSLIGLDFKVSPFNASELTAAKRLAAEIGGYLWLDAIAEKGTEARVHIGLTVQRAIAIMEEEGLDPWRYGFICRDEVTKRVKRVETRVKQAFEPDEVYHDVEIRDGVPVRVEKRRKGARRFTMEPLLDEDGSPVTRQVQAFDETLVRQRRPQLVDGQPVLVEVEEVHRAPRVEHIQLRDEAGDLVFQTVVHQLVETDIEAQQPVMMAVPVMIDEPVLHPVPVMEEVEEEVWVDEPAGDRLGFRYDQLTLFILRGMV